MPAYTTVISWLSELGLVQARYYKLQGLDDIEQSGKITSDIITLPLSRRGKKTYHI